MLIKHLFRTDGRWLKRIKEVSSPLDMLKILDDYKEFEEKEMLSQTSKDTYKVNMTHSEACEWDAHSYCSGSFFLTRDDEKRDHKNICKCSCHVSSSLPGSPIIMNIKVPEGY